MLKIGEFAHYAQVSIATLRHYDQFGLLKPTMLDPQTGYRYYSLVQLPRLHRIVSLKELGFPLSEIAQLLEDDLSLEELQTLFRLKQAHIQQVIALEQERLERVASRLRQIELEGSMPAYEILLKQVEPLLVATMRQRLCVEDKPSYATIFRYAHSHGAIKVAPPLLLWYTPFTVHEDGVYADVELAMQLHAALPDTQEIQVRTLPASLMACTVHPGHSFSRGKAHQALHAWLKQNKYHLSGPPRLLELAIAESPGPGYMITELQFPIEPLTRT